MNHWDRLWEFTITHDQSQLLPTQPYRRERSVGEHHFVLKVLRTHIRDDSLKFVWWHQR